jgi:cytochrome c peroxidase
VIRAIGFVIVCGIASGCSSTDTPIVVDLTAPSGRTASMPGSDEVNPRLLRRFRPVDGAERPPARPEQIALGKRLFFDKNLSLHRDVSCNTCHLLDRFGVDHRKTSLGSDGQTGGRNAPTVLNAASHVAQFWDGRASTIEDQASGPMLNSVEMAMPDERSVLARIIAAPYAEAFRTAFPGDGVPVTMHHVGVALGAFERGLVTTSRWDTFLAGDTTALSAKEKHGLRVFLEVGCMGCHTGPQVGGTMFERVGVIEPWPNQHDRGRGQLTNKPADRMVFKVPGLKNIAMTGPYFHDGSVDDLPTAVRMMAKHQLGIELTAAEVDAIVTWMASMTGTVDPAYIAPPP